MNKTVSSTKLTHDTRAVLQEVIETNEPIVIKNYNFPIAVIIPYKTWIKAKEQTKRSSISELKKYMVKTKGSFDSVKYFRQMRNEE